MFMGAQGEHSEVDASITQALPVMITLHQSTRQWVMENFRGAMQADGHVRTVLCGAISMKQG
jgi:hypothetical protein